MHGRCCVHAHCCVNCCLQGIEQFQRLRVLSAADNLLPDLSCLEVLTTCPNLQVRT